MNRVPAITDKAIILVLADIISQSHQSASKLATLDATDAPLEEADMSKGTVGSSSPIAA